MIIEALERDLPPATLLLGPDLELMARAAISALWQHGAVPGDVVTARHMSAADARNLVKFTRTAPFGPFKAVVACLDGSTAQAQNILLKVLEEPPGPVRFILVSTSRPLPTVVSRCQVVTVPAAGPPPEPDGKVTGQVTAVLKAAVAGDLNGLDAALKGWGDAQHAVLSLLLAEAAAHRPGAHGVTGPEARRLLGALGRFAGAHPRLAAHAALVSVLSDRDQHD